MTSRPRSCPYFCTEQPRNHNHDRAPKLNPPKPFDSTGSEFKSFVMQLNLIFTSDSARYANNEAARVAYAASYLSGSAKGWSQPKVNETTGAIAYQAWANFVAALKGAFDDPGTYWTAERKIKILKQDKALRTVGITRRTSRYPYVQTGFVLLFW